MSRLLPALLLLAACAPAAQTPAGPAPARPARVIDDFELLDGWTAHPSEGVELRISQDSGFAGKAMRLDFDFGGRAGYAIARRAVPLEMPPNWEFGFRIRADAPVNDLEFKLVDGSGENVWWMNRRRFEYPREWRRLRVPKRRVEFAWGPKGGGDLDRLAQLEIVVTAATGGRGTVWIDDLTFREREPASAEVPTPVARSSSGDAPHALDGDTGTVWRAGAGAALDLDFLRDRELGGLMVDWATAPAEYRLERSDDGRSWEPIYSVEGSNGGRDPLYLPETEARLLRLRVLRGAAGIREIQVMPPEWSQTPNAFFAELARTAPRGRYPRYLAGEQSYWTVVGVAGDTRESTVSADGAVEVGIGGPSVEPFLLSEGRLLSWAEVTAAQRLDGGSLPIPHVAWTGAPLGLDVTTFALGDPEASTVYARYRVTNRSAQPREATLFLALRPFQVNPPWQFLNVQGGVASVRRIEFDGTTVRVNGARAVQPLTPGARFGATAFDSGEIGEHLASGRLPDRQAVTDPHGFASGALGYPLRLGPGGEAEVLIAIPLHPGSPVRPEAADALLAEAVRAWEGHLGRFTLSLPDTAHGAELAATIRSQLAYVLINRDGPSIQPGSRSYDRSWIRDGSLTSAALLRLGHAEEVRAFAEWYAPHQRPGGYVPCCVSLRGADPVPEHDSHGQLVYLIAEYYRFTGDRAFLERMWPHVERAAAYIDTLRHQRMTAEYTTPEKRAYFGLLPESISHEGYSAKPMHSYWDDFFAYRGLSDAAFVAGVLGRGGDQRRIAAVREEFGRHLVGSLRLAMAHHRIDYLPGSVELGDFDATSTTVGLEPGGLEALLPAGALRSTFERYYREAVRGRLDGAAWEAYTPYEWRTVGTFLRLGWKERAHEAIGLFFRHRRPAAWNQWAEVVFRDPATPRFIGDMPHTWVGSDFIRSALDLFAYERADGALVIGAGVPEAWVGTDPGVRLRNLRTPHGRLDLDMHAAGTSVRVEIGGELRPPGGIVVRTPLDRPIRRALLDGRTLPLGTDRREVVIRGAPARLLLEH